MRDAMPRQMRVTNPFLSGGDSSTEDSDGAERESLDGLTQHVPGRVASSLDELPESARNMVAQDMERRRG